MKTETAKKTNNAEMTACKVIFLFQKKFMTPDINQFFDSENNANNSDTIFFKPIYMRKELFPQYF